jgi:hypothetical protein
MAGNISLTQTLTYTSPAVNAASPGIVANTLSSGVDSVTTAFSAYERNVQIVTTSKTALSIALISNIGYMMLHNCDSTNVINLYLNSTDTGYITLNPGEFDSLRFGSACVPFVVSVAGSPSLEYYALSN